MDVSLNVAGHSVDLTLTRKGAGWTVAFEGATLDARLERNGSGTLVRLGDQVLHVDVLGPDQARIDGEILAYQIQSVVGTARAGASGAAQVLHVRPPMNGKLDRLVVQAGQEVQKGDVLFVLEAMKMQNEVKAPAAGRVAAIHLQAGATVDPKQVVLDLATG